MHRNNEYRFDQVAQGLRLWAQGTTTTSGAVELLIEHERWLYRPDFLAHVHRSGDYPEAVPEGLEFCFLDVSALARERRSNTLIASTSELSVLDVVLSLLLPDYPWRASQVVGLDATNTRAVCRALAIAAGHLRPEAPIADEGSPAAF